MSFSENLFRKNTQIDSSEFFGYIRTLVADVKKVTTPLHIFVFGSVARNTPTLNSDLDILIILSDRDCLSEVRSLFYKSKTLLGIEADIVFQNESQFHSSDNIFNGIIKSELKEVYPSWCL